MGLRPIKGDDVDPSHPLVRPRRRLLMFTARLGCWLVKGSLAAALETCHVDG